MGKWIFMRKEGGGGGWVRGMFALHLKDDYGMV